MTRILTLSILLGMSAALAVPSGLRTNAAPQDGIFATSELKDGLIADKERAKTMGAAVLGCLLTPKSRKAYTEFEAEEKSGYWIVWASQKVNGPQEPLGVVLDKKDGGFLALVGNTPPSEESMRARLAEKWPQKGASGSRPGL